jgi:hypothetical protein
MFCSVSAQIQGISTPSHVLWFGLPPRSSICQSMSVQGNRNHRIFSKNQENYCMVQSYHYNGHAQCSMFLKTILATFMSLLRSQSLHNPAEELCVRHGQGIIVLWPCFVYHTFRYLLEMKDEVHMFVMASFLSIIEDECEFPGFESAQFCLPSVQKVRNSDVCSV